MDSTRTAASQAAVGGKRAKHRAEPTRERRPQAAIAVVPSQMRHALPPDGRPLDPVLRRRMELRFGTDFSRVRLHAGTESAALAEQAEANAFTVGEHVVFDTAHFLPDTRDGQRLLAHELAHVVQQRRGGGAAGASDAALESHADAAATAVMATAPGLSGASMAMPTPVPVGGASAPALMRAPSGKKKRPAADEFGEEEDVDFDHGGESESTKRQRGKKQSLTRANERDRAGKSQQQVLAEDSEKKLGRIEALMDKPGANLTSDRVKDRRLNAAELALTDLPDSNADKNTRKSRIDERQRTPEKGGRGQKQFVAGGPKLSNQDLRIPGFKRPASHARPDYTIYQVRPDGSIERVHVNLKAHKINRMSEAEARSAAREVLYQAIRNSKHLPQGERLIISFARVPDAGIQEAVKKELFTQNTPISEVRFGRVKHFEADFPAEGRMPYDTDAKSRTRRIRKEQKDAETLRKQTARIAMRQQKADDAKAREYEKARAARLKAEKAGDKEKTTKATKTAKTPKATTVPKTTKAPNAPKATKAPATSRAAGAPANAKAPTSAGAAVKTPRKRTTKTTDTSAFKSATAPAESPRPPPTAKRSTAKAAPAKQGDAGTSAPGKRALTKSPPKAAATPVSSPAASTPASRKVSASAPRATSSSSAKKGRGAAAKLAAPAADVQVQAAAVPRVAKPRPARPASAAPKLPRGSAQTARLPKPAPAKASKPAADDGELQELRRRQEQLRKRERENVVKPAIAPPLPQGQPLPAKPGAPASAQGAPAKPSAAAGPAPSSPTAPAAKAPAKKPPAAPRPPVVPTKAAPVTSAAAPTLLVPPSTAKRKPPPAKPAVPTPPVAKKNAAPAKSAAPPSQAAMPPAAKATAAVPKSLPVAPKRPAVSVQTQAFFGDQVKVTVSELVGAADKPFIVTTRITVKAGGSIGASSTGGNGGSAGLSANGSVTSLYSVPMSAEEKNAYLAAVSGGRGGPQPEMPLIEMIANGHGDEAAKVIKRAQQKAGADPAAAFAQRQDGDVVEEGVDGDVSGNIGANGSRGGAGIGGNVSANKGKGVHRSSRRVGANEEIYSVTIDEREGAGVGVNGGYGVASMGYQGKRGKSERRGISFRLNPADGDYVALRSRLAAATTMAQLQAIARDYPKAVAGHSNSKGDNAEDNFSAAVLGIGLDMNTGSFGEEGEQYEDGRRVRTTSGGSNLGGAVTVAGKPINPSNQATSFSAWVDDDNNAGAEVRTDSTEIDLTKTLQRGVDDLGAHPVATISAIAQGNKDVVQTRTDATGETLNNDSYDLITTAAKNRSAWLAAWNMSGVSHGAAEEWEEIRQEVLAANGDRYKISQAMSKWQKGDSGRRGDVERLIGDTGIAFDFPDEIADQKPLYDGLIVADPTAKARQLASEGNAAQALTELNAISRQLNGLLQKIQMHASQATEGGKYSEMQRRISDRQREVRGLINRYSPKPAAAAKAEPLPPEFVGPPSPDQDQAAKEQAAAERREASEEIQAQVIICLSNQEIEKIAFAKVEDELDDHFVNMRYCFDVLNALLPTYKEWDVAVGRLKGAYPKIGDTPDRAKHFAPNRDRWDSLNLRAKRS